MTAFPNFCGPSYTVSSPNVDNEKTVNWMVEQVESPGGKVQAWLKPTPGLNLTYQLPQFPIRGMITMNERTFVAAGAAIYEPKMDTTVPFRASIAIDSNPVTFSNNGPIGHQLFITSAKQGYVYNRSNDTIALIPDLVADMGVFIDGYFMALDSDNSKIRISGLADGSSWDSVDFGARNTAGDRWQSILVAHRDVWLFGSQRTDVWRNTGNADFPFEPIAGADINQGIAARYSAAVLDNAPVWLGSNENGPGIVWQAQGYSPVRISTYAVETAIQSYATVADAVAFTYQDGGHSFYVLNFPNAGATWVYDAATHLWHERGTWVPASHAYEAYRPQYHAFAFGKHLVGDRLTGAVYEMSTAFQREADGTVIRRLRRTPFVQDENQYLRHDRIEIDFEVGLADLSGLGANPVAMLRWSDNQGKTYSNEHQMSLGARGAYSTRVYCDRLGIARNRIYELVCSAPISHRIAGAWITVSA